MNKKLLTIASVSLMMLQHQVLAAGLEHSPQAESTTYQPTFFSPDPQYDNREYDAKSSLQTYGGKTLYVTPRPLIELGYPVYGKGQLPEAQHWLGRKNPVTQQFLVYGDIRIAAAGSKVTTIAGDIETSVFGTELTLEADWKLTGTERIHATFTPLDEDVQFTRVVKLKGQQQVKTNEFTGEPDALFFEGDLGSLTSGMIGSSVSWDLPFTFGLIPLQFQNGFFLDDAVTGAAFSTVSGNSQFFDISNYDITLFAANDDVDQIFIDSTANNFIDNSAKIFGLSSYFDVNNGHWEFNVGFSQADTIEFGTTALGFTRRYGRWLSNSIRILHSTSNLVPTTIPAESVDGTLLIFENSLITSLPSTFIPYLNLFYADGTPQPLARSLNKGGVLSNVGITFESDALTAFTGLNRNAFNNYGAALGLEYLFDLSQQLVLEVGYLNRISDEKASSIIDENIAGGLRYQTNIGRSFIFKTDYLFIDNTIISTNSIKFEITKKF